MSRRIHANDETRCLGYCWYIVIRASPKLNIANPRYPKYFLVFWVYIFIRRWQSNHHTDKNNHSGITFPYTAKLLSDLTAVTNNQVSVEAHIKLSHNNKNIHRGIHPKQILWRRASSHFCFCKSMSTHESKCMPITTIQTIIPTRWKGYHVGEKYSRSCCMLIGTMIRLHISHHV